MIRRVSPFEARALLLEGYVYLDVRAVEEFEVQHPQGAYNIPLLLAEAGGMVPNPEFLPTVKRCFPYDAKLVLGCKSGVRSSRAADALISEGYVDIVEQRAGWDGVRDPFGSLIEAGWRQIGLPAESGEGGERSFRRLAERVTRD